MSNDEETSVVSNQSSVAGANNQGSSQTDNKDFLSRKEIWHGLAIFFVGAGLGLVIYLISYFSLTAFDIHYLISAILAIVISIVVLSALNEVMGAKKSKMQSPILMVLFIAFVFTILGGYEKNGLPEFSNQSKMENSILKVKILRFNGIDTLRQSSYIPMLAGEVYRLTVQGAPVNLVDGDSNVIEVTQEHGAYLFRLDTAGTPAVKGIDNGGEKSIVKIERQ